MLDKNGTSVRLLDPRVPHDILQMFAHQGACRRQASKRTLEGLCHFCLLFVKPQNINLIGDTMTQIIPGENEGIESALRRFKREVSKAGIFPDMKKHRHFETPLQKHKRKAVARHKQSKRRFRSN